MRVSTMLKKNKILPFISNDAKSLNRESEITPWEKLIFLAIFIIFNICVIFNVIPYLRGPAPYPPDWQWPYLFVNTLSRIWAPIMVFLIIYIYVKRRIRNDWLFLVISVVLMYVLQFSLLYFQRSGILVLIHRIINPDINGYFTAALAIQDPFRFITDFNKHVLSLPMHAKGHPPGGVLFFWLIIKSISGLFIPFVEHIVPKHNDIRVLWLGLSNQQKTAALVAAICIPFLSSLTLVPLYYAGKVWHGVKTARKSIHLYMLIPSVLLFVPINDVFLPLFAITSFFLLVLGIRKKTLPYYYVSGLILTLGIYFSLSLLPLLLFFILCIVFEWFRDDSRCLYDLILPIGLVILSIITLPIILYITLRFDSLRMIQVLMSGLPVRRSYGVWVFYNIYDFLVFLGLPVVGVIVLGIKHFIGQCRKREFRSNDTILISFIIMLVLLDLSGSVRGEVARIWIPYVPFIVLSSAYTLTNLGNKNIDYSIFLFLQFVQVMILQMFWVTLW